MVGNGKGALFVFVTLLLAVAGAAVAVARWVGSDAVGLLVGAALVTGLMVMVSGWVAVKLWRQQRALRSALRALAFPVAPKLPWRWLTRRQWTILTLGLTSISALTGLPAGAAVMNVGPLAAATAAAAAPSRAASSGPASSGAVSSGPTTPGAAPAVQQTAAPTGPASTDSTPEPAPSVTAYLDTVGAVNGYWDKGAITLSGKNYPRSVVTRCSDAANDIVDWNVAGYKTFQATAGISDSTSSGYGGIVEMIFYNQDGAALGKPYDTSIGHELPIHIDLTGVVRLRMSCSARDAKTNRVLAIQGTLGDAVIIR